MDKGIAAAQGGVMYRLKLWADTLAPEARVSSALPAQHSIVYLTTGKASVNGESLAEGQAAYADGYLDVTAGPEGATLWRWGIALEDGSPGTLAGAGVASTCRMSRQVKMFEMVPTSKWLFRLDCIMGFEGATGLHSHPGSGIRCLLAGRLRTESEKGEDTDNRAFGDVWYEEGAYPLNSSVEPGFKATFLRGMVLPPEFAVFHDTAMWIENKKPTMEGWKAMAQKVVTLR